MGRRVTFWADDTVLEGIEELKERGLSYGEIINTLLLEAIANSDVTDELKKEAIHKKHVEARKRLMRVTGFASSMKKVLLDAEKAGMSDEGLSLLIEDFKEEAEELGISDAWREGLRLIYYAHAEQGSARAYAEREFTKMLEAFINDSE